MLLREQIRADLIVLYFRYFDAGMDWLSAYHARVDCFRKIVTQHLVNHRLNLLGCVMNIPLESRLFMPLHFWLHRVHGFHFGEQSVLGLKDIPQAISIYKLKFQSYLEFQTAHSTSGSVCSSFFLTLWFVYEVGVNDRPFHPPEILVLISLDLHSASSSLSPFFLNLSYQ